MSLQSNTCLQGLRPHDENYSRELLPKYSIITTVPSQVLMFMLQEDRNKYTKIDTLSKGFTAQSWVFRLHQGPDYF